MATEAALGFGGNLGDPVAAFATALKALAAHDGIALKRLSCVYRTAPWGKLEQPDFFNMAVLLEVEIPARTLLALCLDLERAGGRERRERWGPRTIDIDILTYGSETIDEPGLQIPHPRIAERAFVLAPLAEIAPSMMLGGNSVRELQISVGTQGVRQDVEQSERLREILSGGSTA